MGLRCVGHGLLLCSSVPHLSFSTGNISSGFLTCCRNLDCALFWPILWEDLKIVPTASIPPSLCAPIEANPMDAIHPQAAQSGLPPNWHGVIFVSRSADSVCVVRAKIHSSGLCGGEA